MKKYIIFLIVVVVGMGVALSPAWANIVGPVVAKDKKFYLLGEIGEKGGDGLLVILKEGDKPTMSPVKIPAGVSPRDALLLYSGEKPKIEYKNCETKYLGFTKRIKVSTKCTKQIASLKKGLLAIQLSKPMTSRSKPSTWLFVWLPLVGVAGILSLAVFFIARGAPAVFFVQYCFWLLASLVLNAIFVTGVRETFIRVVAGNMSSIGLMYAHFCCPNVIEKWVEEKPELKAMTIPSIILVTLWVLLGMIVINVLPAFISSITGQLDFIIYVFSWLVFGTGMVMVANAFPGLAKKYLNWI